MNLWAEMNAKYDGICERLDNITQAMGALAVQNDQLHSVAYREWEPFVLPFGDVTDSNKTLTLTQPLLSTGWEGHVDRISVTVAGASSSATVAVYRVAADPMNLIDFAGSLIGNNPSRIVGDYNSAPYFRDDEPIVVVVAGSAAAGNTVTVRVEGRRRQV